MYYRIEPNGAVLCIKNPGQDPCAFPSWEAFVKEHPEAELDLVYRLIKAALNELGRLEKVWVEADERIWIGGASEDQPTIEVEVRTEQNYGPEPERTYFVYIYESAAPDPIANEHARLEYHWDTSARMAAVFAVLALINALINPVLEEACRNIGFPSDG